MEHARAVFAPGAELHLAAQMMRHQLHPVANAEHRNAERKNLRIELRRALVVNAGRPAGKDDALRLQRRDFLRRDVEANDLGIDLAFANPARDDLGVLRTEIEDENLGMGGRRGSLHGLWARRVRSGRVDARIIGSIDRNESSASGDAALEFFARLLRDRFFQRIGATGGQDRARDAKGGREGFQALRRMSIARK